MVRRRNIRGRPLVRQRTKPLRHRIQGDDNINIDDNIHDIHDGDRTPSPTAHHHHYEQLILNNHAAPIHDHHLRGWIDYDGPASVYHDHAGGHDEQSVVCTDDHSPDALAG
jgi:hypothetical protein